MRRRPELAVLPLALAALSACAGFRAHGIDLRSSTKLRLLLLPVRCAAPMKDRERVAGEIAAALEDELKSHPEFEVEASLVWESTSTLTADELKEIGRQTGAQALLEIEVSAYGKVKARTIARRIAVSVVKGTVAGAAAAGPAGPVAGVAAFTVGLVQGTVVWTAGTDLFNNVTTPVILDAKLYSGSDGRPVWTYSALAMKNSKALKQLSPERRKDQEVRLSLAAEKAAAQLVRALAKTARRNLDSQAAEKRGQAPAR